MTNCMTAASKVASTLSVLLATFCKKNVKGGRKVLGLSKAVGERRPSLYPRNPCRIRAHQTTLSRTRYSAFMDSGPRCLL